MDIELTYFCKKCNSNLPRSSFYSRKGTHKLVYPCKTCKGRYYKMWKAENPEYHKNWKEAHPEQVKLHHKKYIDKQKDEDNSTGV